jgi:hypothetical protein
VSDVLRRDPAPLAFAAGLALVCAGMAIAIAGVVVPGLFLPGVILLDIGFVASAVAAVLRVRGGAAAGSFSAAPGARAA